MNKRLWWKLIGVIVLVLITGLISAPKTLRVGTADALGMSDTGLGRWLENEKVMLGLDLQGGTQLKYRIDMSKVDPADQSNIVEGIIGVITNRVNGLGVSEPVIQSSKLGDSYYIIVELPGIKDIEEAKSRVGKTVQLEFKEQKTEFSEAEKKEIEAFNADKKKKADKVLALAVAGNDFTKLVQDNSEGTNLSEGGVVDFKYLDELPPEMRDAVSGTAPGKVYGKLIEVPNAFYITKVLEKKDSPREKTNADGSTTQVTEEQFKTAQIILTKKPLTPEGGWVDTGLTGEQFKHASVQPDQNFNFQIAIQFNDEGAKKFGEITTRNIGKPVAIFLDGRLISSPTVQTAITDGQAVITGQFTTKEANELATNLNTGAIPAPIQLIGQSNIGATLGQDALQKGIKAGLIGIIVLTLFLLLYYRLPGLMADLALCVYAILVLAIFKIFNVTLTLAGIAGFILSVGMAVDANVLIFERLKEEIRSGKTLTLAMDTAFRRAWSSIRDSNISSLITCFVLFYFGTGLIKGFAVTLALGILCSMFTAISVTRTFVHVIIHSPLHKKLWLWGVKSSDVKSNT